MTELSGAFPPVPTYLAADGTLDVASQRRAIEHALEAGATGVVVLGTAGEGPVLPPAVRASAIDATVAAAGDTPVLVGCAAHTVEAMLGQLNNASARGAGGALVLPPFYYRVGQRTLGDMVERIADASPLDLLLYHIPALTGTGFDIPTVERLAAHPRIVGMKDSARDFVYHLEVRRRLAGSGFRVFQGAAPLVLASTMMGSEDSICPVTALVPHWERDLRVAVARGDHKTAAVAGQRLSAMAKLFNLGDVPMPVNFKAIAALLALGPSRPHEPALAPDADHWARLADGLRDLGLDVTTTPIEAIA